MKVLFRARNAGRGIVVLYCRITINKVRTKSDFSTHVKLPANDWDSKTQLCSQEYFEDNEKLSKIKKQINTIYDKHMQLTGKQPTAEVIKYKFFKQLEIENYSILNVLNLFLDRMKTNPLVKEGTKKKHEGHHKKIAKYLGMIKAESLDHHHLDDFYNYLRTIENNGHNTAIRTIEYLKRCLKNAFEKGYLSYFPCNDYTIKRDRNPKKAHLSKDELKLLIKSKFKNNALCEIRDAFVFCCYTGLDYGDYMSFSKDWIKEKNGEKYIEYSRKKSGQKGFVRLFEIAEFILEKYDYCLPKFVNQNYNKYIKEVCFLAGIPENKCNIISTHSARVTAGMIWLNEGISMETVSKMLAHASVVTTQNHYAEITLDTMLKETKKIA
ncbi:site-specific integrase [Chondrinema litorale]|uniref:site-specific integrase n=1 Tax=Chondrinema litorale TaxID=2994555 RepID=UPI002543E71E|nr:site-specific integrase [Chondrinema litorale]UZR95921.1 phage integrase SAM-like domain-containing protein [Chondrinema litorale]